MNYSKLLLLCLLVSGFVACDNDDEDPDQDLVVQLSNLPTLNDGFQYEGWAVIDGTPVSTGTFTRVDAADEADEFSGDTPGPAYPGEDFLVNAPDGLTFPTDLSEANVVISIEPDPDDSALPFFLKPLAHQVPANAEDHMVFDMENNIANTLISGTATKR